MQKTLPPVIYWGNQITEKEIKLCGFLIGRYTSQTAQNGHYTKETEKAIYTDGDILFVHDEYNNIVPLDIIEEGHNLFKINKKEIASFGKKMILKSVKKSIQLAYEKTATEYVESISVYAF